LLAARTDGPAPFAGPNGDFDAFVIDAETGRLINKSLEAMATI
jgi:hypothetical protein